MGGEERGWGIGGEGEKGDENEKGGCYGMKNGS